ncbi:MAG: hypothetical protein EZS28_040078, partial [Streblomastix strix]
SIALVIFGVITFVYAVYIMAVIFHGIIVIAFQALYVGISIKGFGIVGIIENYDLTEVNGILLFVIRCTYFIIGKNVFVADRDYIVGLYIRVTRHYLYN